jgi:hypothetical protein
VGMLVERRRGIDVELRLEAAQRLDDQVRNQLLLAMQKPDATRVAGFKAWLALCYCVRRRSANLRKEQFILAARAGKGGLIDWAPVPNGVLCVVPAGRR